MYKKLVRQVWWGVGLGLLICLIIDGVGQATLLYDARLSMKAGVQGVLYLRTTQKKHSIYGAGAQRSILSGRPPNTGSGSIIHLSQMSVEYARGNGLIDDRVH